MAEIVLHSFEDKVSHFEFTMPWQAPVLAAHRTKDLRLTLSNEFGVPGASKEAIKFAALARATINMLAHNIPAASGAKRFGILGKLVQPSGLAKT